MPFVTTIHYDSSEICAQCGASQEHLRSPAKLKNCGGCKSVWYCSEKCQRAAQDAHRSECRAIRTGATFDTASKAIPQFALCAPTPIPSTIPSSVPTTDYPPGVLPAPGPSYKPVRRRLAASSVLGKSLRGLEVTPMDIESIGYSMTAYGLYNPIIEQDNRTTVVAKELGANPYSSSAIAFRLLLHIFPPNTYLSSLPQEEAYYHIIDCFRLKMEDEHVMCFLNLRIYGGESNKPLWKKYMALVGRSGVLPMWWNKAKRKELEVIVNDEDGDYYVGHGVESRGIEHKYGDGSMPVRLRELGGKIFEHKDLVGKWYE